MGTITSGSGIFSGIDSRQLIEQLLAIESRPKLLAQRRIVQLQGVQAANLDISSRMSALRSAAAALRGEGVINAKQAVSSDPKILAARATTTAAEGSYTFVIDRLVSSQQVLSRGVADRTSGLGVTSFSFESAAARLDRDTELSQLNGGLGVERGKIVIAVQGGQSATVDLSKAATVSEVLDAINNAGGVNVSASVQGGRIVLQQRDGSNISVTSATGGTTAASLGIEQTTFAGATVTGQAIARIGNATALRTLNDGNGIFIGNQAGSGAFDFQIAVTTGGTTQTVNVNLGDVYDADGKKTGSAVTNVEGALKRINDALTGAGLTDVRARVKSDGGGLEIFDPSGARTIRFTDNATTIGNTVRDLGFTPDVDQTGTVSGRRIMAGLNSTLAAGLNGGAGVAGGGALSITGRDGVVYNVNFSTDASLSDILAEFSADTGGKIQARINRKGTGIEVVDSTGSTTGNLIIGGASAAALGIATEPGGVAASTFAGGNLERQYVTLGTTLASLTAGRGVGTGQFRITDSLGAVATVNIGAEDTTFGDVIREINARGLRAKARINSNGDGIEIYEELEPGQTAGTQKIRVEDAGGNVAARLNLAGTASGVGSDNKIDGTFERKVTIAATDSIDQIAAKLNAAGAGVSAAVVRDGSSGTPFRLSLSAVSSGSAGRFLVDTAGADLGLKQVDAGQDARAFFGSKDPAKAVLLTSSTNTLDGVVAGLSIDLLSASADPVTIGVSRDFSAIEKSLDTFISAFNTLVDRIGTQTRFVPETGARGPLLGDATITQLRTTLASTAQARAQGVAGAFQNLAQVGLTIGQGGKLELDREEFRRALTQDPQAVTDVLTARVSRPAEPTTISSGVTSRDPSAREQFSSLGVIAQIEQLADRFANGVDGVLTRRGRTLDDQLRGQRSRITAFDQRLASRRQILERQFLAMEQAIGQLSSQQGAIGSIGR